MGTSARWVGASALVMVGCTASPVAERPVTAAVDTSAEEVLAARGFARTDVRLEPMNPMRLEEDTHYRVHFRGVPIHGFGARKIPGDAPFVPDVRYAPIEEPETVPRITQEDALAAARAKLGDGAQLESAEVVFSPKVQVLPRAGVQHRPGPPNAMDYEHVVTALHLAFRLDVATPVPNRRQPDHWTVLVDALDGSLLSVQNQGVFDSLQPGTVNSFYQGVSPVEVTLVAGTPVQYTLEDFFLDAVWYEGPFAAEFRYQSLGNTFGDGKLFLANSDPHSPNGQTAAGEALDAVELAWNMFTQVLGRDGPTNDGVGSLKISVHMQEKGSFYLSRTNEIEIGYASLTPDPGTNLLHPMSSTDVVSHEVGHQFYTRTHDPTGYNVETFGTEGMGLNEGTGDIIGFLTELYRDANRKANPPVGIDSYAPQASNYTIGEGGLLTPPRSMISPVFGFWSPGIGELDEHESCGPIDRMFLLLAYGCHFRTPTRPGVPPDPFICSGVTHSLGVGPTMAGQIWQYVVDHSSVGLTYDQARILAMQKAKELDGGHNGGLFTTATANAFYVVGVGDRPDTGKPTVTLNCKQDFGPNIRCSGGISDEEDTAGDFDQPPMFFIDGQPTGKSPYPYWGTFYLAPANSDHLTAGPHTVTLKAWDDWENEGEASVSVNIYLTPPVVSTFQIQNLDGRSSHNMTLVASSPVGLGYVEFNYDDAQDEQHVLWSSLLSGFDTSLSLNPLVTFPADLAEGTYQVNAFVADFFSNPTMVSLPYKVDHTPPEQCQILLAPFPCYVAPTFSSWLQSSDSGTGLARVTIALDNATPTVFQVNAAAGVVSETPIQPSNLALGVHTVKATCVDAYNNSVATSAAFTVVNPPQLKIDILGLHSSPTRAVDYRITATDQGGLTEVESMVICTQTYGHGNPNYSPTNFPTSFVQTYTTGGIALGETCYINLQAWDHYGLFSHIGSPSFVITDPPPPPPVNQCNTSVNSGMNTPASFIYDVGASSGTFDFQRNTYIVPDMLKVTCEDGGTINGYSYVVTTCESTEGWSNTSLLFNCNSSRIRVDVTPDCYAEGQTDWDVVLGCAY